MLHSQTKAKYQKVAERVHYYTDAGAVYLNQNADYEAGNLQVNIYMSKQRELHIHN